MPVPEKENNDQSKIILGMIMLNDETSFEVNSFFKDFENNYSRPIVKSTGDNLSLVFEIDNESIIIGHAAFPIPVGDIEGTAKYAYNWESAITDLKAHKSHLIISLTKEGQNQIKCFKIFTQVIASLLRTTNSIGVYKGNQSLLIPKEDYLNEASFMSEENLPLNLWIYFGLRVTGNSKSGYTYGLKEFNKTEMEILYSAKKFEEIREFLFGMTRYILEYDITFKDGQTCGFSEDEKIAISFSKGKFVPGDSFKFAY